MENGLKIPPFAHHDDYSTVVMIHASTMSFQTKYRGAVHVKSFLVFPSTMALMKRKLERAEKGRNICRFAVHM